MNSVVIIDDSTVVRKIVEISLRRMGIVCISYEDGFEALCAFKQGQSPIPNLIFLDIGLPKMNGLDLLRLLKTSPQFDQTVIVMLTGHDSVLDKVKSRIAGARGYITKPFTTQDLVSVVLSCLDQHQHEIHLN
ncbi:MAG TPA: response regulator [Ktedonobacteraceae bacterium]|nr:response regulator [Ktedonobacteraceae bacterium]